MNDHENLTQMQQSWPETEDYLRRVGQVTNDQMVLREAKARDEYESSLTWLDKLAVDVDDVTKKPTALHVLQFLFSSQIVVRSMRTVPEFLELLEEHEREQAEELEDESDPGTHLLEDPYLVIPSSLDDQLWALPELQKKLQAWGTETAQRFGFQGAQVTLSQACILMNVVEFLNQGPAQSPGWAEECLRSALSSEFFEKAGSPQP